MNKEVKIAVIVFIVLSMLCSVSISAFSIYKTSSMNQIKNQCIPITSSLELQDGYDLLIIAPEAFKKEIQPLVNHKNDHGIKTILVSIETIVQEMMNIGRDDAEKMKYYIHSAVEKSEIKYVLLIGGRKNQGFEETWWVPVRYSQLERRYDEYPENQFLTDLYFADIYDASHSFSSWDSDNDGVFGEWKEHLGAEDIIDLYPDIAVGRLPCRNNFDVRIIVNKIISYENNPASEQWFKNMVVVAGDTYPHKTSYIDGEVYTQRALENMSGFTPIRLWTSDESLTSSWDTVRVINEGCGFIYFSGHGNPASWGTHPPYNDSIWINGLKLRHMPFLFNKNKLPVCITGSGCFNSMFNVSLLHHPYSVYPIIKCWSEALLLHPYGGSIATIGASAFSYESIDVSSNRGGIEQLDIFFFEQYGKNDIDILGDVWTHAMTTFLDRFPINWDDEDIKGDAIIVKNAQQWVLLGDPTLKIGGYE